MHTYVRSSHTTQVCHVPDCVRMCEIVSKMWHALHNAGCTAYIPLYDYMNLYFLPGKRVHARGGSRLGGKRHGYFSYFSNAGLIMELMVGKSDSIGIIRVACIGWNKG